MTPIDYLTPQAKTYRIEEIPGDQVSVEGDPDKLLIPCAHFHKGEWLFLRRVASLRQNFWKGEGGIYNKGNVNLIEVKLGNQMDLSMYVNAYM